jgi:ABC-type dipeptide/oligopeptide/nickel transport system permease component
VGLAKYLLRRLGAGLLAMLGVSVLVFLFLHAVPGDPVDHLAGGEATVEQRKAIEECMGLDQSMPTQFVTFLGHVVDGSLGHQCPNPRQRPTVADRIFTVLPYTVRLALVGMALAFVLALPLGILAAVRRGTWVDTLATVTSLSGIAIPIDADGAAAAAHLLRRARLVARPDRDRGGRHRAAGAHRRRPPDGDAGAYDPVVDGRGAG